VCNAEGKSRQKEIGVCINITAAKKKGKIDERRFSAFLAAVATGADNFLFRWVIPEAVVPNSLVIGLKPS
jgi:hypothetical protein